MIKYLITYFLLQNVCVLPAQTDPVDTRATYVIANGGLNIRSGPSVKSKKIAKIPFGTTIKYISDKSFGIDSNLISLYDNHKKESIKGNWVKVQYKKSKGYVLDLHLYYPPNNENRFKEKYNSDFVLLYPGCGCNKENLYNPLSWEWFGYIKLKDGKFKIEKINVSYYRTRIYTCDLLISASKSNDLAFIIGSKTGRLSKREVVYGNNLLLQRHNSDKPLEKSDLENASIEMLGNKENNESKPNQLYLKSGNKRQLLNKPEYDYPYEIKFVGDLDGDLKDDYIIHYGDKGGIIILYLTTKAKPSNLIEPVAMYFASYCC